LLVIDANVVVASLIGRGTVFLLIKQLNKAGIKLFSPSFLEKEIEEHFDEIMEKTKLDKPVLKYLISELLKLIEIEPKSKYEPYMEQARKTCSDSDDIPYLALSLSLGKAPIWSFDEKLKEDCSKIGIRVLSSVEEVMKELLPKNKWKNR
jgi:predicted nucleic acid-binding protein